jgi:hypothetical protein
MSVKVGSFFIDLVVDAASGNLSVKQLVSALGELDVVSVGSVGIISKVTDTLYGMAKAAMGTAVELTTLRDIAGTDPKIVQQWEKAAARIGISTGTIARSIMAVNAIKGRVETGGQPPMELSSWLGINMQTGRLDKSGHPVLKNFFDIMAELGSSRSKYWALSDPQKQQSLGAIFGGAGADVFRILKEQRAGNFDPSKMSVLNDKQVKDLTDVSRKETEIGQQFTSIFQQFMLGGGAMAEVLDSLAKRLKLIDDWLASKQGQTSLATAGRFIGSSISHPGDVGLISEDVFSPLIKKYFIEKLLGSIASAPARPNVQLEDLEGRLEIRVLGQKGELLGQTSDVFIGRGVKNSSVLDVTLNAGNGGPGQ